MMVMMMMMIIIMSWTLLAVISENDCPRHRRPISRHVASFQKSLREFVSRSSAVFKVSFIIIVVIAIFIIITVAAAVVVTVVLVIRKFNFVTKHLLHLWSL